MGIFLGIAIWIGLCAAVASAASGRGRDPAAWFFVSLFFSPLLAILLLLAFGNKARPGQNRLTQGFKPTDVFGGVPCRIRADGGIDAMLSGGVVQFPTIDQFLAAVPAAVGATQELRDKGALAKSTAAQYPDSYNGYHYKKNSDGSVDAVAPDGLLRTYPNWRIFWDEASYAP
jgi:hypothetical protein